MTDARLLSVAPDADDDCGRCAGTGIAVFGPYDDPLKGACPACLADDDCWRCGGTGEYVEEVLGRTGMVACDCRSDELPVHDLKFAHTNVGLVLDGLETATVRYQLEPDVASGDILQFQTPNGRAFAYTRAATTYHVPVRHAYHTLQQMDVQHPASGTHDLHDRLNQHYQADVTMDDAVDIIAFDPPPAPSTSRIPVGPGDTDD